MINEIDDYYHYDNLIAAKSLLDRREVQLWRFMFNWRLYVGDGPRPYSYEDGWCFPTEATGLRALQTWDGEGEPEGWIKHPASGRYRPNGDPKLEYNQRDPREG